MLTAFPAGVLPGVHPREHRDTDVASFEEVEVAARGVLAECVAEWGLPGWVVAGARGEMGVFIWGSGAVIDGRVRSLGRDVG